MARFEHRETLGAGAFDFPYGLGAFFLGGTTAAPVLYAATLSGGGVNAFAPDGSGGLTHIGSIAYPTWLAAGIPPVMAEFGVNGIDAILVSGLSGYGLVTAPGGDPQGWTSFGGHIGVPAGLTVAGTVLLSAVSAGGMVALGESAGGPQLLSMVGGPGIAAIARLPDGSVHAVSPGANTITRYTLDGAGQLNAGQIAGALDGLGWSGPAAIEVAASGGQDYLIVASAGSSSLTVLTFDGSAYRIADHIIDDRTTRFAGVTDVDSVTVNGRTLVAAGGSDDGVSVFELLPNGRLVHLQTFEDTLSLSLANVSAVSLFRSGAHLSLVVAGQADGGVSVFSRPASSLATPLVGGIGDDVLMGGAGDDLLWGGGGNDFLNGGAGDDILYDGAGSDILRGGPGADIFVFAYDGEVDRIEDFEPGLDRLDLSAFPLLYSVRDLDIVPVPGGARISYLDEVIELRTANGMSLGPGDFTERDILGVTRPPLVPLGRDLEGTAGPDTLLGASSADRLRGLAGDDVLSGFGGNDLLDGGPGNDTLDGGAGRDVVMGGAGSDFISGGDGANVLMGGPGDDVLLGGAGPDVISGGSGNDRIEGGPGNDTLRGGPGADVFVFADGAGIDRITDFVPGVDRIDLSGHSGAGSWADVRAGLGPGAGGAVIDLGRGDLILLSGLAPGDLSADDFLF
jgi:Ca2+-binding RTX toxin-like protein